MFKVTFNKPAVAMFFSGEDAAGIEYKSDPEAGTIQFRPVPRIDPDSHTTVPVTMKMRGGIQAVFEGSQSAGLLRLLTNPFNPHNPYFTLKRKAGGWMEAVPHVQDRDKRAPERWEPHIRVWQLDNTTPMVDEDAETEDALKSPIPAELPPTERAREALFQIETLSQNISKLSFPAAFKRVTQFRDLIGRFEENLAQVPKDAAPAPTRSKLTPKVVKRPLSAPAAQAAFVARSRSKLRERAFATS